MPPGRIPGAKWSGLGSLVDGGTEGRGSGETLRPQEGEAHVSDIAQVGAIAKVAVDPPGQAPKRRVEWNVVLQKILEEEVSPIQM